MNTLLFNKAKMIDHLAATAEVLQTHEWCRGEYRRVAASGEVSYCLMGAHMAAVDHADPDDIRNHFDFANAMGFSSAGALIDWNDLFAADKGEVLDRIISAIERVKNEV